VIAVPPGVRILLAAEPVDFRKGMDGLAALVQQSQADLQKFQAMQSDILNQIMQMLGAPAGEPAGGPPVASPGVGGENAVGYS